MLTPAGWQNNVQIGIDDNGIIGYVGPEKVRSEHNIPLILPAPVNLHSHAFQRAMSGLTEMRGPDPADNFWTWRKLMYRFLDRLNPDHIEAIASLVFMEMLEAGFAGVTEFHYLHHDQNGESYNNIAELSQRIIAAAEETGIGLTLLPVLYQYGGCDLRPLEGGQKRFYNTFEQYSDLFEKAKVAISASHEDYSIGVAPHSLRAVDPEGLDFVLGLNPIGPIHMHLAEQIAEVDEVKTFLHARPTEWLLDNQEVNQRWCLIHCTQMNAIETKR